MLFQVERSHAQSGWMPDSRPLREGDRQFAQWLRLMLAQTCSVINSTQRVVTRASNPAAASPSCLFRLPPPSAVALLTYESSAHDALDAPLSSHLAETRPLRTTPFRLLRAMLSHLLNPRHILIPELNFASPVWDAIDNVLKYNSSCDYEGKDRYACFRASLGASSLDLCYIMPPSATVLVCIKSFNPTPGFPGVSSSYSANITPCVAAFIVDPEPESQLIPQRF